MTPREFDNHIKGFMKTEQRSMRKLAWLAANIINCWVKKRVTPDKLLGETSGTKSFFGVKKQLIAAYVRKMREGQ